MAGLQHPRRYERPRPPVQRLVVALAPLAAVRPVAFVDALAAAEACDLSILHYDADFELVAAVTGQRHEWIVGRGLADA